MVNVSGLVLNSTCFAVIAVVASSLESRKAVRSAERVFDIALFRDMSVSVLAMIVFDSIGWALDGVAGNAARIGLLAADAVCFALYPFPLSLYLLYADFQVDRSPARSKRLRKPLAAIAAVVAAMALVSPFTGFLFGVDGSNRFVRGPAFPAFAAILFGLVAWSIGLVFAGRRKISPSVFWILFAYPLPVAAAALGRYLAVGLDLVWPVTTVFLVTASFNIEHRRASIDHLTGTANRRTLDEELARLVEGGRTGRPFGGIMLDLDDFKSINDRLGHESGDRALEDAAAILRACLRSGDIVTRYGGDEFVVLVPGATGELLLGIVDRVEKRAEAHNGSMGRPYSLSFSMGAALFDPAIDETAARFLARLDSFMYADKASRKVAGRITAVSLEPGSPRR